MTQHTLQLDTKSQWRGLPYIGFVCDCLREYLRWDDVREYMLDGSHIFDAKKVVMRRDKKEENGKIVVVQSRTGEGNDVQFVDGQYEIHGFPEDRDFGDFQRNAQGILDKLLKRERKV